MVTIVLEGAARDRVETAVRALPSGATATVPVDAGAGRVSLEVSLADTLSEGSLFDWAVFHGFTLVGMTNKTMDLEEIFHRLTRSDGIERS
jgi:hypothetical protein